MVLFNIDGICNKGTQSIQRTCSAVMDNARDGLTPLETTAFVAAGVLVLWQIVYQIHEYRRTRVIAQGAYVEMQQTEDPAVSTAPAPRSTREFLWKRVNSLVLTIGITYLILHLAVGFDLGRRNATQENCNAVTAFSKVVCAELLNATYHAIIPYGP